MAVSPGSKLGPYEIVALLGVGGMGEVYRARDSRLGRDVAIKVLPASLSADPERVRRFQQEARAVGALSHPNILSVHDVGESDGVAYLVTELLDGSTLRDRMGGTALPKRKAVEYAVQTAQGLAAAHAAGIVHRDLKPENLFVTRDGRIKILDFGLAKLTTGPSLETTDTVGVTEAAGTTPGTVLGTIGYLSPEQVRGEASDHRSDIFSLGAILYEMLTGRRAFRGPTKVETMTAILRHEPEDMEASGRDIDPALERIVRRCLEKSPDERFQSARDLAFQLTELSSGSESGVSAATFRRHRRSRRRVLAPALAAALTLGALAVGFALGTRQRDVVETDYRQLTFRRGTITAARFSPDGGTVVYSAIWDGEAPDVYTTSPGNPESRPLGLGGAGLLAISAQGELAVSLRMGPVVNSFEREGTLASLPLATSTAPREIHENIRWADWARNGTDLAVVAADPKGTRLEYPVGTTLLTTPSWISHPRVSPDGRTVAFLEHPQVGDDRGFVAVVDRDGNYRRIGGVWSTLWGLAWRPDGEEIWFTGGPEAALAVRRLYAMTLDGRQRLLAISPGELTLHDVSVSGETLLSVEDRRRNVVGLPPGATEERDFTWLDRTIPDDLSADGEVLLFHEGGKAGAVVGSIYTRKLDGSPAVRLAEGYGVELSPDRKWALSFVPRVPGEWRLVPTGAGSPRAVELRGFDPATVRALHVLSDGRRLVVRGERDGKPLRSWVYDVDSGTCEPLGPDGAVSRVMSPDGRHLVMIDPEGRFWVVPTDGGTAREILGIEPGDEPIALSDDTSAVITTRRGGFEAQVVRVDPNRGAREIVHTLRPPNRAGLVGINIVLATPDGRHYVYGYTQQLSELYLAQGIR